MNETLFTKETYDNLPELILQLTNPFNGRDRDIILLSTITVLSACLPKVYGYYDGNKYATNLYLLITAPPASGKGIMGKSKILIEKIHNSIKQNSLSEIENCKRSNIGKKENKKICPDLVLKILPGNVSSSKIYKHLQNDVYGLLMFETEADTVSSMLKQDWGNFSDVLRKAFHHETISISREADDKYFEISHPKLSLVLSGTPGQVAPLINSQENGLFSRFIFYYFNDTTQWKDVSPAGNPMDEDYTFQAVGDLVFQLHNNLLKRESGIEVKLTVAQWETFNELMTNAVNALIHINKTEILPSVKRHGVIMFRICMILSLIRNHELEIEDNTIYCDTKDFDTAIKIIKVTLDHSIIVSNLLAKDNSDNKRKLNMRETIIFAQLNQNFTRQDFLAIGAQSSIPKRTLDFMIYKFLRLELILKISNGKFQKKSK